MPHFCDPTTYVLLDMAAAEVAKYCDTAVRPRASIERVCHVEIKRLVYDGYVLGRVEESTEKATLLFSTAALPINDPETLFRMLCAGAVKQATSGEPFTATEPRDTEIGELLRSFADQAARSVIESIPDDEDAGEDWRRFGAILSSSVHLGREIALTEGYFLNPKKRKELDRVIETGGSSCQ